MSPAAPCLQKRSAGARRWIEAKAKQLDSNSDNVYCIAAGSKPHALALALYSLAREKPAVLYIRPTVHQETDVQSNGQFWLYRLRDRTVID